MSISIPGQVVRWLVLVRPCVEGVLVGPAAHHFGGGEGLVVRGLGAVAEGFHGVGELLSVEGLPDSPLGGS
jgi:hypothetical protein